MNGFSCIFFFVYFVGKDAGELYIKCECLERILVSKTYGVTDCTLIDYATSTDYWEYWVKTSSLLLISRDTVGTLLTNTHTTSNNRINILNSSTQSSAFCWDNPFAFEFDIITYNGTVTIDLYDAISNGQRAFDYLNIQPGDNVKVASDGTNVKYYINNELTDTKQVSLTQPSRVGFIVNTGASLKYKNFKVYPIG